MLIENFRIPSTHVRISLPDNSTDQQVLDALHESCEVYADNAVFGDRLKLIIGRVLLEVSKRKIYKNKEFGKWRNWREFVHDQVTVIHNISFTTAYESMKVAQALPNVSLETVDRVGSVNLVEVAKILNAAPEAERSKLETELMPQAEKLGIKEFRRRVVEVYLPKHEAMAATSPEKLVKLHLTVTQETAALWFEIVGERDQSEVFADMVRRNEPPRKRRRAAYG